MPEAEKTVTAEARRASVYYGFCFRSLPLAKEVTESNTVTVNPLLDSLGVVLTDFTFLILKVWCLGG